MTTPATTYILGDVHGQLAKAAVLLHAAGLIDAAGAWTGGPARLHFTGDFADRGPDGIGVINLVMRLQQEAAGAGGEVSATIGNHEVMLLAAHHFRTRQTPWGTSYLELWAMNGGVDRDMEQLQQHHIEWLSNLPALLLLDGNLMMHADSRFYEKYGSSVEGVNGVLRDILQESDETDVAGYLEDFFGRLEFVQHPKRAAQFLERFGGHRIIHGHTPIPYATKAQPSSVHTPWVYADGRCVNVDGGMFLGGPGFLYTPD